MYAEPMVNCGNKMWRYCSSCYFHKMTTIPLPRLRAMKLWKGGSVSILKEG
jgi:hypothetical protein